MVSLSPYSIPPLAISILFLFLGSAIYFKNKRSAANTIFALLSLVTFWWQFSWFVLFNVQDPALASILVKVGYMGIIFIPVFFYHFFLAFMGRVKGLDKYALYFMYAASLFFEISLFSTNFFIQGYYEYFWGFYPKAGILHPVYLFFLTAVSLRSVFLLYKSYLEEKGGGTIKSKQTKNLLIGLLIYFSASTDFLVNYGIEFYPLGFIFVFICLSIIAYSISKYHMFDIRVILTEMLVGIMAVASFVEALLFQDLWTRIFGFGIFALLCVIGYLLTRYTYREVRAKENFEQMVQERTKELEQSKKVSEDRAAELEKWYKLTIGRELRMAELKDKIKEMEDKK
ncbi:MAG: histidine kinase N-terminal 7TM domain-containing protein [Candidatus Paceibacterota bacterium]|jgi:hypothetical protein